MTDASTDASTVGLWHSLAMVDTEAMTAWLRAVGFVEHATYRDEDDPSVVNHAEWLWPGGGGIMVGTLRPGGGVSAGGRSAAYLVAADPAAVMAAAVAAGGREVRPLEDKGYGGAGGTVTDPDGNEWSVGTYQPR